MAISTERILGMSRGEMGMAGGQVCYAWPDGRHRGETTASHVTRIGAGETIYTMSDETED